MKKLTLLTVLTLGIASASAQALVVECLVSGTATKQEFTAHYCSSATNTLDSGILFNLKSSKPIADVTWSYAGTRGNWRCNNSTYCSYQSYYGIEFGMVEACATRVLYKDGTWENTDVCAEGEFWYTGGGPIEFGAKG
ncbi:hypothetical protein L1077_23850 [Pseudoalteromonas luteoviolacea]|uniref:hypothetical protein n=1 Tax=Pseudoalteromonas luteoviolacea TaxID=43657 RepID=UPI001F2E7DF3|nr:hypothetical protein [Pseudoalteromonas luteoviolacea]MCF6442467.1 hypothetical protein [Pseudoalteromonas luteoviolacea]